jgi:serine/threonine protein kinase
MVALAALTIEGSHAIRFARFTRVEGWTETRDGHGWRVATVDPLGPAAGRLESGDRLVSIDNDSRISPFGAHWVLHSLAASQRYAIEVERGTERVRATLTLDTRDEPINLGWPFLNLIIAAAFYVVGMTMAIAKPDSRTVQWGYAASLLNAAFFVWVATRPADGIHRDGLAAALGVSFPLHVVAALIFMGRFPEPVATSPGWQRLIRVVIALSCALWIPRSWVALLHALPPSVGLAGVELTVPVVQAWEQIAPVAELACGVVTVALIGAVLARNYRLQPGPGERRRIRLVLWSHALAFVPAIGVSLISAMLQALSLLAADSPALLRWTLASNALFIASPASFGYAMVKHRVMGFRVFVRLGILYMLAQNVLRVAVALPAILIVYAAVSNPNRTVSEVLFTGSASAEVALIAFGGAALRFRGRLAAAIDRRFFRTAYDQEIILMRLIESIKQLDSLSEISAMVSREIDAALHPTRLLVLYRSPVGGGLFVGNSQAVGGDLAKLPAFSTLIENMVFTPMLRSRDEVESHCTPEEVSWFLRLQIELLVPITGIDRTLYGLLLLGEKRSEEPYTSKDRTLLQMVASQVGAVCEVLALREQVGEQYRIQSEVLGRLERQRINLVRECPTCGRCFDSHVESCSVDGEALVLSLPVDRTLQGKYRLERLIGRGGMGAVYVATDLRLNRSVAVKVVKARGLAGGAAERRFAREARACGRLEHPNIVRVYDFGMAGETAFLVMEYVKGVSWRAQLDRMGVIPTATAAAWLDQVLNGIEAAHRAGILHRDLKPENLLICEATADALPQVKILDFGLAKVRQADFADPKSTTMAGMAMGTFGYMSPEQLSGEEVDEGTDIYAIGVIALETLTGRLRVDGPHFHWNLGLELNARLGAAAVTEPQRRLARAIGRALAPNRVARFISVAEMRAELVPAIAECPEVPIARPVTATVTDSVAGTESTPDAPTFMPPYFSR